MHFEVGDIVVRVDISGRKRYRIERVASDGSGWIYARPVGGGGTVTFPSQFMLKKVEAAKPGVAVRARAAPSGASEPTPAEIERDVLAVVRGGQRW